MGLSITGGIVSTKFMTNLIDFDFEKVIIPFLDRDVPRSPFLWCVRFTACSFFFIFIGGGGGEGAVLVVVALAAETNFKFYNKDIDAVGSMGLFSGICC